MTNKNSLVVESLQLLGYQVKDRVTGIEGIVTTITFDLYGCVQALVHPGLDKEGKARDQHWLDVARLHPIEADAERAMPVPQQFLFDDEPREEGGALPSNYSKGPAEKPPTGRF